MKSTDIYNPFATNDNDSKWEQIRIYRNKLLRESDFTMLEDYSGTKKQDWKTYRKTLRELPQNYVNPDDVIFPMPPG